MGRSPQTNRVIARSQLNHSTRFLPKDFSLLLACKRDTPDIIVYFVVLSGNVGTAVPALGQWKERGFGERIDVPLVDQTSARRWCELGDGSYWRR